jgi:broad specificity phosphatase PhoE
MSKADPTLYFLRHGETDWNAAKRYQGQTDIPLNDRGRAQAARNGRVLAEVLGPRMHELRFIASPLLRTAETMQIARREMGLEPEPFEREDRLKEIHFGDWEGQLWDELPAIDPVGFAARLADPWSFRAGGGESYEMLSERIRGWLDDVQEDIVVVSHGGVSRVMRGLLLGLPSAEIPLLDVPQDRVLQLQRGRMAWL